MTINVLNAGIMYRLNSSKSVNDKLLTSSSVKKLAGFSVNVLLSLNLKSGTYLPEGNFNSPLYYICNKCKVIHFLAPSIICGGKNDVFNFFYFFF